MRDYQKELEQKSQVAKASRDRYATARQQCAVFDSMVRDEMQRGMTAAQARQVVARANPEAYKAWTRGVSGQLPAAPQAPAPAPPPVASMTPQQEDEASPEWNNDLPVYRNGIDTRHRIADQARTPRKRSSAAMAAARANVERVLAQVRPDLHRLLGTMSLGDSAGPVGMPMVL